MSIPTDWLSVLSYTHEMLDAARAADWLVLEGLQHKRHNLLLHYFADLGMDTEPEKIAIQIKKLQEFDDQIMACCLAGRDTVGNELHDLSRGKKAGQAYLSHSR